MGYVVVFCFSIVIAIVSVGIVKFFLRRIKENNNIDIFYVNIYFLLFALYFHFSINTLLKLLKYFELIQN